MRYLTDYARRIAHIRKLHRPRRRAAAKDVIRRWYRRCTEYMLYNLKKLCPGAEKEQSGFWDIHWFEHLWNVLSPFLISTDTKIETRRFWYAQWALVLLLKCFYYTFMQWMKEWNCNTDCTNRMERTAFTFSGYRVHDLKVIIKIPAAISRIIVWIFDNNAKLIKQSDDWIHGLGGRQESKPSYPAPVKTFLRIYIFKNIHTACCVNIKYLYFCSAPNCWPCPFSFYHKDVQYESHRDSQEVFQDYTITPWAQ